MIKTTITLVCAAFALTFSANANAQGCCGGGGGFATGPAVSYGGFGNYGSYGVTGFNDCGRDYTNDQAASLWAGYCTDTCDTGGSGCGLFSRFKNRGGGCGTGCGGAGGSCFGWPGGCGIGAGCLTNSCGGGCGGGGKLKGLFANRGCRSGCGLSLGLGHFGGIGHLAGGKCRSGCGLFSKSRTGGLFGGCGGGCGLFSKLKGRRSAGAAHECVIDECGCGNNGQYFDYAVGAEYGTAGMQSAISGQLTGCCGDGMHQGSVMAQPMQVPTPISQPIVTAPMVPGQSNLAAPPVAGSAISIDGN